jgi:hypothetical protein
LQEGLLDIDILFSDGTSTPLRNVLSTKGWWPEIFRDFIQTNYHNSSVKQMKRGEGNRGKYERRSG